MINYINIVVYIKIRSYLFKRKEKRSNRICEQGWYQPIALSCPFKNQETDNFTILTSTLYDSQVNFWCITSFSVFNSPMKLIKVILYLNFPLKKTIKTSKFIRNHSLRCYLLIPWNLVLLTLRKEGLCVYLDIIWT